MATVSPHVARVAAGLATLALAALSFVWWRGRESARPSSVARDAVVAELRLLRRSQERAAEALERLERVLPAELARPAPPAARSLAAPEAHQGVQVTGSLDALVQALDALRLTFERESSATRELIRATPELGGERLVELRERRLEPDWNLLASLERDWRFDRTRASRSQYFQTARDLLRTYGPPSAIYRPQRGGLQFVYRAHAEGEAGTAWYFQVQEGYVVEFFIEDEQG